MNWDALGAIAELIGAVTVISTLIYLALQVRHGRESTDLNTMMLQAANWRHFQSLIVENENLAKVIVRHAKGERLEDHEIVILRAWFIQYAASVKADQDLFEKGLIDTDSLDSISGLREQVAQYPLFKSFLKDIDPALRNMIANESGT